MDPKSKKLYDAANSLYLQAKALMDKGELTAEEQAQVDALLDQVEAKTIEAKRLERMEEHRRTFEEPDPENERKFFTPGEGEQPTAGDAEYKAAFGAYLRHGDRGLDAEQHRILEARKALAVGEATAGGYLVQDTFLDQVIVKSREVSAMRDICLVLPPVPSGSVIVPSEDSDMGDPTWTTELGTGAEDTIKPFGGRKLTPHPLARRLKVSNTLLRAPRFQAEAWIRDRFGYRFGVVMENGYVNGNGAQQPQGLLNTPSLPTYTTAASNVVDGDDLIHWVYRLPAAYQPRAKILCNRAFIRKVRLLKITDNYLWQPGLQSGVPSKILDFPYALSDRFDDGLDGSDAWEDNAIIAVVGDFQYYWIVDAGDFSIQRLVELYAETNQTGFIGRWESDGMCVLAEAFYALKVKA